MKYRITILLGLGFLGLVLGQQLESDAGASAPPIATKTQVEARPTTTTASTPSATPKADLERLDNLAQVEQDLIYRSSETRDWSGAKQHAEALLKIRQEALAVARNMNSPKYMSRTLGRVSRAYYMCGDFANAESHLLEAIELAPAQEAKEYLNEDLFDLYDRFKMWDKAKGVLEQRIHDEKTPVKKFRFQLKLVRLDLKSGKLAQAEKTLSSHIASLESADQSHEETLSLLARCWELKNDIAWENDDKKAARAAQVRSLEYKLLAAKARQLED